MQASMLGKTGSLFGAAFRALTKHRPASEPLARHGAWLTSAGSRAHATNPVERHPFPRGAIRYQATGLADRPFVPFVCRDAHCCNRFDLAASGK